MPRIPASSADSSRRMAKVRQKGTAAELALRREIFRIGLRYRVNYEILKKPRRVADIVFPRIRVAIFVDGCFWHGCPEHASWPKENAELWREKIEANRARDADTDRRLRELGWEVVRIWAHESPADAARHVSQVIEARKQQEQTRITTGHGGLNRPQRKSDESGQ
jgi:DNA mismatch endonuclease (patch repair protein)